MIDHNLVSALTHENSSMFMIQLFVNPAFPHILAAMRGEQLLKRRGGLL